MTLAMPDSVRVRDLPPGYPAYLGYADGALIPPTAAALRARFPGARLVILTVTGGTLDADGCDVESGDLSSAGGATWALHKLRQAPMSRPVLYASVSAMSEVIDQLGRNGIDTARVRLLSAHYGRGEHICGPRTCAWPGVPPMDGTQWTNDYPGLGGSRVDMSVLGDGFFGLDWTEKLVNELPVVRKGDVGPAVRTVQGLCCSRGHSTKIDGIFGVDTDAAVRSVQADGRIANDGVVGRLTWPVLLALT